MTGVLDDLLDARRAEAGEPVAEAFDSSLHPRGVGTHGGEFVRKLGAAVGKPSIPRGSGPAAPAAPVSSRRKAPERAHPHMPNAMRKRTSYRTGKVYGSSPVTGGQEKPRKLTEHELPKAVGSGAWSQSAKVAVPKLLSGAVEDTEHAHRLPNGGPYTPERTELHARIVRALLQGAGSHSEPEALFMAGGPASGKSSLLKAGVVKTPTDAVDVNPDIVKTMIPEYHAMIAKGDKAASAKVHEESSHIAKLVMNLAMQRKHHVIVDGVGDSGPGKFAGKVQQAIDAGHRAKVVYATIDTEEALRRSEARGARTGRHVPAGYLRSAHMEVTARFHEDVRHLPVMVQVFDTSTKRPKLAWSRMPRTSGEIHDRKAFEKFMAKMRAAS